MFRLVAKDRNEANAPQTRKASSFKILLNLKLHTERFYSVSR